MKNNRSSAQARFVHKDWFKEKNADIQAQIDVEGFDRSDFIMPRGRIVYNLPLNKNAPLNLPTARE